MPLRALEKLGDGGVSVYDVQKIAPGKLKFRAKSKESEKIFAILRGSCYTVNKCGSVGLKRRLQKLVKRPGAIAAALLVCLLAAAANLFVLRVEVDGSVPLRFADAGDPAGGGDCTTFRVQRANCRARPRAADAPFRRLRLSPWKGGVRLARYLPGKRGNARSAAGNSADGPPCDGVLQELTVLRGVPLVQEGEKVSAGQKLAGLRGGRSFGRRARGIIVRGRVHVCVRGRAGCKGARRGKGGLSQRRHSRKVRSCADRRRREFSLHRAAAISVAAGREFRRENE